MAEGGDLPSIKDGSDADFKFACTPCGVDNIREEAVKYCQVCKEYLCATCTRHHRRQTATRSHKILATDDALQTSVAVSAKCRYHPDRDIEMYCGTHDMVYCTKCIATEHRECSCVINIDELPQSKTPLTETQQLRDGITSIYKLLVKKSKEKQNTMSSLEDQRCKIQEKIKGCDKKVKEHFDKLTDQASHSLHRKFTETKGEVESEINLITDIIKDIEKSKKHLQNVTGLDYIQQFVYLKLVQKSIAEAKNVHFESEAKGTLAFGFTENSDLLRSFTTAAYLGEVVVKNVPRQCKVKARKDVNVKMQCDGYMCYISDVCQLQDGTFILTDFSNKKTKRFDINYKIRDHCELDDKPMGICSTGQNEIAVKIHNNKIQFISVGAFLFKSRDISVEGGCYWGLAYYDGELWVSIKSGINVYSRSGSLLKSIVKDGSGQNIFNGTIHHMAVYEDSVIVTDGSDGALCLTKDGTVKRQLRDHRLSSSVSACVSYDKSVFLSGYYSNNIVIFSGDGKCQGELVTNEDGISSPGSLCYDKKRHSLILTCLKKSDNIYIFDLSH